MEFEPMTTLFTCMCCNALPYQQHVKRPVHWDQFFLTFEGNIKHNSNKNDLQKYKACFPLLFSTLAYQVIFLFSTKSVSHHYTVTCHQLANRIRPRVNRAN